MIDGVGQGGAGRIDPARQEKGAAVDAPRAEGPRAEQGGVKSAVLDGRYPVDPARIAVRMLQLDLPRRG